MSQQELANRLGVPRKTVNNWCTVKLEPNYDTLIKISKILDETIDYLLGNDAV